MIRLDDIFFQFRTQPRRALVLEFAFVAPAMALAIVAGFGWGGHFWLQDRVQAAADRALAAANSSPDLNRRRVLALAAAQAVLGSPPTELDLLADRKGRSMVRIVYEPTGGRSPVLGGLALLPPRMIVRHAAQP